MDLHPVVRVIEIVVGIGILVLVHELGHFLSAKWAGVRVDKFAIGMGPKLWGFQRGETEYSIRWLPVGGFVMMAGEEPGVATEAAPERQFRRQKPGNRAVILFAGSFMNFVLAIAFFAFAFGVGVEFTRPLIGFVAPGGPADEAGLRAGDEIVAMNGDRDIDWEDVRAGIMLSDENAAVVLTVLRDGRETDLTVRPSGKGELGLPTIGIEPSSGRVVKELKAGGAAEAAGLKAGDVLDTVDGRRFLRWGDLVMHLTSRTGVPVKLAVLRDGREESLSLVPRPGRRGSIGVTPATFPAVEKVLDNSPAAAAGVLARDHILAVDGTPTPTLSDVLAATASRGGKPAAYTLRRGDETLILTITPVQAPDEPVARVGIVLKPATDLTVGAVDPGSPAEKAGVCAGDVFTHVGKTSLADQPWDILQFVFDEALEKGKPVTLRRRNGQAEWPAVKIEVQAVEDPLRMDAGFAVDPSEQRVYRYPLWRAPFVGLKKSFKVVRQVYVSFRGMITGRISAKHAAGPVGIVKLSYAVAAEGVSKFVFWLAFLSANFAVVNLLPMPPFDGGLIVVTAWEKLRGKPVSDRVLMGLQTAGWGIVILLLIFITFNDIMR